MTSNLRYDIQSHSVVLQNHHGISRKSYTEDADLFACSWHSRVCIRNKCAVNTRLQAKCSSSHLVVQSTFGICEMTRTCQLMSCLVVVTEVMEGNVIMYVVPPPPSPALPPKQLYQKPLLSSWMLADSRTSLPSGKKQICINYSSFKT